MQASLSARLVRHSLMSVPIPRCDRELIPSEFWRVHPDSRVSLENAHAPLIAAAERLSDEHLGLKVGGALRFGAGGAFDYAVRSAATLRDSVEVAGRFARLVADSTRITFETFRNHAIIRLDVDPVWPQVVIDFAASAWFKIHLSGQLPDDARLECWFPYREPKDRSTHERMFEGTPIKFEMPLLGFAVRRDWAAAPLPGADPVLHSMHRARVESLLSGLSPDRITAALVRRILEKELERGIVTANGVARALHMSRSTLARRLAFEGTEFAAELDAVRRERALTYIRDPRTTLTEVAFRSGFSHVESFYRAFKRWTGCAPGVFRANLHHETNT
ncbi:MAG TPA: AraC family transcriptional regulator ligand-binding domain-containing protein [Polyangiaceae bacterium]|nr:AraC family transcriptional regulator ligand-binding domain-containing protein [Polyangiaceae bacterium]